MGREILLILASQYQQNLDDSTLVIYNNPRNTILIKAKLRFFFLAPQSERSEEEEGMEHYTII